MVGRSVLTLTTTFHGSELVAMSAINNATNKQLCAHVYLRTSTTIATITTTTARIVITCRSPEKPLRAAERQCRREASREPWPCWIAWTQPPKARSRRKRQSQYRVPYPLVCPSLSFVEIFGGCSETDTVTVNRAQQ